MKTLNKLAAAATLGLALITTSLVAGRPIDDYRNSIPSRIANPSKVINPAEQYYHYPLAVFTSNSLTGQARWLDTRGYGQLALSVSIAGSSSLYVYGWNSAEEVPGSTSFKGSRLIIGPLCSTTDITLYNLPAFMLFSATIEHSGTQWTDLLFSGSSITDAAANGIEAVRAILASRTRQGVQILDGNISNTQFQVYMAPNYAYTPGDAFAAGSKLYPLGLLQVIGSQAYGLAVGVTPGFLYAPSTTSGLLNAGNPQAVASFGYFNVNGVEGASRKWVQASASVFTGGTIAGMAQHVAEVGSCTPIMGSIAVSPATGATLTVPSGAYRLTYHLSMDSGATAYCYSSLKSADDALGDGGDSFGYTTYGVGGSTYPIQESPNDFENLNGPAFPIYFATKGGTVTVHWAASRVK